MSTPTLSTHQAARMLGLTPQCIGLRIRKGDLPAERDETGRYRIPEAVVVGLTRKTGSLALRRTHTLAEASTILGIGAVEIKGLIDQGHMPAITLPTGRILVESAEIEKLLTKYRS